MCPKIKMVKDILVECPKCNQDFIINGVSKKELKEGIEVTCAECEEEVEIFKEKLKKKKYLGVIRMIFAGIGGISLVLGLIHIVIFMLILWLVATYYDGKHNYFNE